MRAGGRAGGRGKAGGAREPAVPTSPARTRLSVHSLPNYCSSSASEVWQPTPAPARPHSYEAEALYFDSHVREDKFQELSKRLLAAVQPLYQAQVGSRREEAGVGRRAV